MVGAIGVNVELSSSYTIVIVQIGNSYYGQIHQVAAHIWSSNLSNLSGNFIIVCDRDIDIYNLKQVFGH